MSEDDSLLSKLDAAAAPLARFDAFPKVPSTYKARSESRGFMTLFVAFLAFMLMLNDIGEYIWGWPDYEFSIDNTKSPYLNINIDMVVNMPCKFLSIDLRDSLGDRLFLSGGLRRDGVKFDASQATALKEHAEMLSARQAVAQSRKSRGFFGSLFSGKDSSGFAPLYNYEPDGSACRVAGTLMVKRVTANLHITTLGHGYQSYEHVDHSQMNLSHVITEFSFGPFFPEITQPLDNSFEVTHDPFVAYQYFLHVVPTTYIAPRTKPLETHQYSVTHYTRVMEHNAGTPGIFFKFDLDPLQITLHQRTTSFLQLLIRCVGVIGGVFVCTGYAIRITTRAVEVVSGADSSPGLVAAEASGAKTGLRAKWGGGDLRSRNKIVRQGSGWAMEGTSIGSGSPYSSYAGTPATASFPPPQSPFMPMTPSMFAGGAGQSPSSNPGTPPGSSFGPSPHSSHVRSPSWLGGQPRTPYTPGLSGTMAPPSTGAPLSPSTPPTPGAAYSTFPSSPSSHVNGNGHTTNGNGNANGNGNGIHMASPPRRVSPKKDD